MQGGSDDQAAVEQLVDSAQQGDGAAFAALYERHSEQIFRYVSFKTGNRVDAEDITGEVFVRMVESIGSFRWQGHAFSSWLYRIAHNLIVDHFRKRSRRKDVPLDTARATMDASASNLDSYADVSLTMDRVREAMRTLTNLQREVISLRFAAGLSVLETARVVGKKENAVKALQHAGLKKLRRRLAPESPIPAAMRHEKA